MNIARLTLAAIVALMFASAVFAQDSTEAHLVIPDSRILPGVPFDFWIEVHNRGSQLKRVTVCAPFEMRILSGEPLRFTEGAPKQRSNQLYWPHGGEVIVGPGESKTLVIPASDAQYGEFLDDRLFSAPGRRVGIRLPLCQQIVGRYGQNGDRSTVQTNEVEIEIVNPSGSDATVWNLMEETLNHRWTPAEFWRGERRAMWESVLRDSPDSNYVPYALITTGRFSSDWRDLLAQQLRAIERFPESPAVEWLHVEAWLSARAIRAHGVMLAEGAIVRHSKRPTTRLLAFGNEQQ